MVARPPRCGYDATVAGVGGAALSQEELGGCIGASHRAVATALGDLRRLHHVATGWRTVTVVDARALRELIR